MKVWTNGCFDILHCGHIEMFAYAKSLGDHLVVGIDADARVEATKGPERPINSQEDRKRMLEAIKYIDEVVIFNDDEGLKNSIKKSNIDIIVVGSDWEGKKVIGAEQASHICFFNRVSGYSTTNMIEKICNDIRV